MSKQHVTEEMILDTRISSVVQKNQKTKQNQIIQIKYDREKKNPVLIILKMYIRVEVLTIILSITTQYISLLCFVLQDGSGCSDSLSISKGLIRERNASRDITSRFNGQIFVIETSESSVVLTFRSCFPALSLEKQGYGFRTIITKQSKKLILCVVHTFYDFI